jgi:hypothetical protein
MSVTRSLKSRTVAHDDEHGSAIAVLLLGVRLEFFEARFDTTETRSRLRAIGLNALEDLKDRGLNIVWHGFTLCSNSQKNVP